jgi:PAS domain S-box-containing protein
MEKIRAELRVAEQRYQILFDHIPGATAIYKGIDMEIVMANAAMLGFWGRNQSVIGKKLIDAVPELDGQVFIGLLQQVYLTGETYATKEAAANYFIDGTIQTFYYDFTYRALKDADNHIEGIIHSATDVTSLVNERSRAALAEERLNFSLQSAAVGTWSFDALMNTISLDKLGQQLYGITDGKDMPYEQTLKNIHPDDIREVHTKVMGCLKEGNVDHCDIRFRVLSEENEVRWLQCIGKAVFKSDKTVQRFAGIVRDITKEVAGIEEQRKLQMQKDKFLSIASHELKTPVTSIKAYAQLLTKMLERESDTQKVAMITRLTGQINRLNVLIDDLVDVSKISNDRLNFQRDYHAFNEIVKDSIEDISTDKNTHEIITQLDFNGSIYCDRSRIGQVIKNMLSNAIKYSPGQNKVLISTRQSGNNLLVAVQDYGIGVSDKDKNRIFDQFYRVSTVDAYAYQGMGLGLFISAEIIRQEGGKIWVDSVADRGAIFCFSLPLINSVR